MNLGLHTTYRLPAMGQVAFVRVCVADEVITGTPKATAHGGRRPPGTDEGLQLKH